MEQEYSWNRKTYTKIKNDMLNLSGKVDIPPYINNNNKIL